MTGHSPDLAKLRRRDEAAWQEALPALKGCAFHMAFHAGLGLTPEDADDVAMETLREVFPRVPAVRSFDDFKRWVGVIAKRRAIDLYRRRHAEKRGEPVSLNGWQAASGGQCEPVAPDCDPAALLAHADLDALLDLALAGEDPVTRQITRDYARGAKLKDLAQTHGYTTGGVGPKISRALGRLAEFLEQNPKVREELRDLLRYLVNREQV
jgi:DNA-directed RNA polymerase specialized sigma24 family protein